MNYDHKHYEAKVKALLAEDGQGVTGIDDAHELLDDVEAAMCTQSAGPIISAYQHFNRVMGSLRPREFTALCGTTGTGKTTLIANIAAKLIVSGVPLFVASVETGPIDFVIRLISALEGRDLNTGDPIGRNEAKVIVEKWRPILKKHGLLLARYTNKVSPMRIMTDMLHAHEQYGAKVVMIDNLNYALPIVNARDANTEMDRVVHDLIAFCKSVEFHTIMVAHPRKRSDESGDARVESELDIKGSATLPQESSNVLLLNRPTKAQEQDGYDRRVFRELKFAKLRRRGQYAGARIMFENVGSRYLERELFL